MKAITLRPPWSLAVAAGVKLVENRGQRTSYRGPIAIHSGATWGPEGGTDFRILTWWLGPGRISRPLDATHFTNVFRRLLAVADLVDCHQAIPANDGLTCCQPWGDRLYETKRGIGLAWHLVLDNVRRLDEPVPAAGQVMVPWTLPEDVAAEVERQTGVPAVTP
jgi:hypothetical protein